MTNTENSENIENINGKKFFNFKLIGIGLIFLLDFNVNTVDILPDFIAVIFISAGIGKTWYVSENLSKVKTYLKAFFAFSMAKLVWNIFYLYIGSESFDNSILLLLTTSFSLIELILSMAVFLNIFKELESFSVQGDRLNHAKTSDYALKFINFFIIAKFIITVISQIPVIITDESWERLSMVYDMYLTADFVKNLFITPCFIVQTLIGILVLSVVLPFFFKIGKDKNLYDFVKSKINRAMIGDNLFNMKQSVNFSFSLFIIGCVFFVDFFIDNISILPDFMICVLFLLGIITLVKENPEIKSKKINIYLVLNFFISFVSYILGTIYRFKAAKTFTGENIDLLKILRFSHNITFHVSVILFFLIFIELYIFIKNLQRKHLDFTVRYFNKYMTSSEKEFDKNKNRNLILAAAAFCVKNISVILPNTGLWLFFDTWIVVIFVFLAMREFYLTKNAIFSYYN